MQQQNRQMQQCADATATVQDLRSVSVDSGSLRTGK